jgi:hypothetical protein
MMDDGYETYILANSFEAATKQARWLSRLIGGEAAVRPDGVSWAVRIPAGACAELTRPVALRHGDYSFEDEERADLTEDFSSDQDDWARSDEDGWFYDD